MNFDWNPEQSEIRRKVSALFDEEALAELEGLEQADLAELNGLTARYLLRLAGADYLTLGVGTAGRAETLSLLAAQETLARLSGSLFLSVETTARLFGGLLASFGEREDVANILKLVSRGELIGAVAVSEPEPPGPYDGSSTTGVSDGADFVVTGSKDYVTNGPIADWLAVTGNVEGRPAVFLIEPGLPGVSVGPRLKTVGYNGLAVASLELDGVRVPQGRVIGPFDDGSMLDYLGFMQDLVLTVAAVGLIERTLDEAKDYARVHRRGGKEIFRLQEVRFKLAEMLTWSHSAGLFAFRAGWLYSTGDPEARTVLHCAKVFCAEAAEQVSALGMQIMAGRGYVSGNPIERAYRDAKLTGIAGTTSEKARMSIADDLLKRYQV